MAREYSIHFGTNDSASVFSPEKFELARPEVATGGEGLRVAVDGGKKNTGRGDCAEITTPSPGINPPARPGAPASRTSLSWLLLSHPRSEESQKIPLPVIAILYDAT